MVRLMPGLSLVTLLLATVPVLLPAAFQADAADIDHGRYLFDAAGCLGCHTDKENKGAPLAGGRRFETPFGVYYSPNITPDRMTGIGNWSMADFLRALRYGENPDGENYFPVFPYTSYTKMSDGDILDLKAYIFSLAPVRQPNLEHEAGRVFGSRFMVGPWKVINFRAGPMKPVPDRGKKWNRGAYLVEALGHCGECHTPRDRLGGTLEHQHMAGTAKGPGGEAIPNITPDQETGIGKWPDADLKALFSIGMLPDGDFVSGGMAENVSNTTGKWSKADAEAVIEYLKSLPPVINKIKKDKKKKTGTDEWN